MNKVVIRDGGKDSWIDVLWTSSQWEKPPHAVVEQVFYTTGSVEYLQQRARSKEVACQQMGCRKGCYRNFSITGMLFTLTVLF